MNRPRTTVAQAGEALFQFAIERDDLEWLASQLPPAARTRRHTLVYELQILKIIGVGWCIAYYLENHPHKTTVQQDYWQAVQELSGTLSEQAGTLVGSPIDYFQIIKNRLDSYRTALARQPNVADPLKIIGPAFALACQEPEDVFAIRAGAKMFMTVMTHVRAYLNALSA